LLEALIRDIREDDRYRADLDELMLDRLDQSLIRKGPLGEPEPGPLERLVQSAGILSLSADGDARREAFTIASAAYELYGEALDGLSDALRLVMSRLGNFPSLDFRPEIRSRPSNLPTPALLEAMGRRIGNTVETLGGELTLTDYQRMLWADVSSNRSVVASAPTSAGKSFIFQQHLAQAIGEGRMTSAAFIVPTRALIGQVAGSLAPLLKNLDTASRVMTVPVARPGDDVPTIYVMTQERIQVLLADPHFKVDFVVVDEAHLVGDGHRGIILQSAIDELIARNPEIQLLFTLPPVRNAGVLADMFKVRETLVRRTDDSPVGQNIILLDVSDSVPNEVQARGWTGIPHARNLTHALPRSLVHPDQKLVYLAWFYGRGSQSIVYGDTPARCEALARLMGDVIDTEEEPWTDSRLSLRRELSKFIADHVHPQYELAETVLKGIGFHYGNMPTLVRQSVEQAFDERVLDFMICTSTLLQGVNLPARNIFMRKPEKGDDVPLSTVDFWNLAGRAGRLGKEFEGNVFLVDYKEWDAKPLDQKQDGEIRSAMRDQVVGDAAALLAYIGDREAATDGNSTLENAFSRLFRDHRLGRLEKTLDGLQVPAEQQLVLREALDQAARSILVSDVTLAANPYMSPHRQQRLYAKLKRDLPKKGVEYYMPPHPAGEWKKTQQRLINVYRRLQVELDGIGKSDAYKRWATLSLLWMRGQGLPEMIDYAINRDAERVEAGRAAGGRQRGRASPSIIRGVLKEVENGLRFKFVRQMSCYNSVLRQVLLEEGHHREAEHIPAIPLFLEVGASSGTMLSFIDLGLSRISARLLQSRAANYDMDLETAVAWLQRQDLTSSSLPSIVLREIALLRS
jgi:hypothetical protein